MKIIYSLLITMFIFTASANGGLISGNDTYNNASATAQQAQGQDQIQGQAQGQAQYSKNVNLNNDNTTITYKAAKNLPGLSNAASIDTRAPELQLNGEQKLFAAAEAEIASAIGNSYTDSYKYTNDRCTAIVSFNDKKVHVHVSPSGSAKHVNPAVLDRIAHEAVAKLGTTNLMLTTVYMSIENHSHGTGVNMTPQISAIDKVASTVVNNVLSLVGAETRTSERVRLEFVYTGTR